MRRQLTGLRARLLVIVLLALAPAVALLFAYADQRTAMEAQRARADIVRVLEADQHALQDLVGEAEATLITFSDSDAVRRQDWKTAAAAARRIRATYDDYLDVGIADGTGRVVVSAIDTSGVANVSDRSFYRRAVKSGRVSAGDSEYGAVTKRPSITIAHPVLARDGAVRCVAYVAIDLRSIRRRLAPGGLAPSAVESLLDSDAHVIVTTPRQPGAEGKTFGEPDVTRVVRTGDEGSATVTGPDGKRRDYLIENVFDGQEGDLFLVVGFTPQLVFGEERGILAVTLAGFGLAALVAGSSAWALGTVWIYWPTRRLATAATRIGRGDLEVRARLKARGDEIGTLGREFDSMAEALESRVAELQETRLELAALNVGLEERVRRRTDELEVANRIAGTLQQSLLSMPETMQGVDFGHFYGSATESTRVGGDFYDLFRLSGPRIAFTIGDVSGKGLEAASLTALVKNTLRAYAVDGDPPHEAVRKTNVLTQRFTAMETFVTVFFGVLDTESGRLSYTTAGHPPPLLVGPAGVSEVPGAGSLLGAFAGVTFEPLRLRLEPGQMVVAYTDGIIEARNPPGEFYGEKRFRRLIERLRHEEPASLAVRVSDEMRAFGEGRLSDDMALLALRPTLAAVEIDAR